MNTKGTFLGKKSCTGYKRIWDVILKIHVMFQKVKLWFSLNSKKKLQQIYKNGWKCLDPLLQLGEIVARIESGTEWRRGRHSSRRACKQENVVVVYHVTIVAIGHGLLKDIWPLLIGCVLRTAGSSIIWNYADPLTSLELLNRGILLVLFTM